MNEFFKKKSEEIIKYRFSDPQKTYDLCCELLEHSAEYEQMYEEAYARMYMGDALLTLGRLRDALDMLLLAQEIQKKHRFDDLLVKNYNITAIIYITQGDDLLALDYYFLALELAKKHKAYRYLVIVNNNIGALLHNLGERAMATEYFERAWKLSQKDHSDGEMYYDKRQLFLNIGHKFMEKGEYREAKTYLESNLAQIKEGGPLSPVTEMCMVNMYVHLYYHLGDYEAVLKTYDKLMGMPKELFGEQEVTSDLTGIALVMIRMGKMEEAKALLLRINSIRETDGPLTNYLALCNAWIRFYEKANDSEGLCKWYEWYYEVKKRMKDETNRAISTALENRQQLERQRNANRQLSDDNQLLVKKSETDELTKISNRYGLNKQFVQWSRLAQIKGETISMGLFDIDYFKVYNDRYGHLEGDNCLQTVARILRETVAASDGYFVARYGGDEFIVMGIGKTKEEICAFADMLFARIHDEKMSFGAHPSSDRLSISMGIINRSVPSDYRISEMVHEADEMLYEAKKSGKNCYKLKELF